MHVPFTNNHGDVEMKLKCLVFASLFSAILFGSFGVNAQTKTLACTAVSEYLGSNGGVFYDNPVPQCDLFMELGNGFYGDVWASRSSGHWMEDFGDEVDLILGRYGNIGNVQYDVSGGVYIIADPGLGFADVFFTSGKFSFSLNEQITPYVKVEYYMPTHGSAPKEGLQTRFGTQFNSGIGENVLLSLSAEVFHDTGAFDNDRGWLGDVQVSLRRKLSDSVSVGIIGKYYAPITTMNDGRHGSFAYGLSIITSF